MRQAVIVAAARTAIGKFGGSPARTPAPEPATVLQEMRRRDAKKGLASLCIGGGIGVALAVQR